MTEGQLSIEALRRQITSDVGKWEWNTRGWMLGYCLVLLATIVFPIIIAAEASLADSAISWIGPYIPVLAILTAAAAALDQVLRSGPRWRSYMRDKDAGVSLRVDLEDSPALVPAERRDELEERWEKLKTVHDSHRPGTALDEVEVTAGRGA